MIGFQSLEKSVLKNQAVRNTEVDGSYKNGLKLFKKSLKNTKNSCVCMEYFFIAINIY